MSSHNLRVKTFIRTSLPTVNDDFTSGYAIGSRWILTGSDGSEYLCLTNSVGAAIWKKTAFSGSGPNHGELEGLGDDDHPQYTLRSHFNPVTASFFTFSGTVQSVTGALQNSTGSLQSATGSLQTLTASYLAVSASYNILSASYLAVSSSYNTISSSYLAISSSYNILSESYLATSASYDIISASYRPISASYNIISASYISISGAYRNTSASFIGFSGSHGTRHLSGAVDSLNAQDLGASGLAVNRVLITNADGGWTTIPSQSLGGGGPGVSDHGDLTGLGDDDHTQYVLRTDFNPFSTSVQNATGSLQTLTASYLAVSASYNVLSASYLAVSSSYNTISASYMAVSSSYNTISGSYKAVSASYNTLSASYYSSPPGASPYYTPNVVTIYSDNAGTWTNMPTALTEFQALSSVRARHDFASASFIRFMVGIQTGGTADAYLAPQWSTDETNWHFFSGTEFGAVRPAPTASMTPSGFKHSPWIPITASALGVPDLYIRIVGSGSNGTADPGIRPIMIGFK